ncbi:MAG: hypothetical protein ACKV2U_22780 [Bryobacteraceae bacterium]
MEAGSVVSRGDVNRRSSLAEGRFLLPVLGVNDLQAFAKRYFAEEFVGNNEVVHQILAGEIDCNGELERIKGTQAMGEAVLSDQTLRG